MTPIHGPATVEHGLDNDHHVISWRRRHQLSPAYPKGRWNMKDYLVEKADEIAAQQARWEAQQAASHAEMMASIEAAGARPPT